MHKKIRVYPAYALLWVSLSAACVDSFDGSIAQVDFGPFLPAQVRPGQTPTSGFQLPAGSHYRLYGIIPGATPVLEEIVRFKVRPVVDLSSPCLADPDSSRFPGIHITQYAARLAIDTGIPDFRNPPANASEQDKIDLATADVRVSNARALGRPPFTLSMADPGGLKAVVSTSSVAYPAVSAVCEEDGAVAPDLIPSPLCTGDASNAKRLRLCKEFWAANPGYYEGSDLIITQPLNGDYFGMVLGVNPINRGTVGGAQLLLPGPVRKYGSFALYAALDDTPTEMPGFRQILVGSPSAPARGVIRIQFANFEAAVPAALRPGLQTQMVVFENVGDDNLHF